uniref:Calcium channel, voltage-dependent, alpha 2/delta subunit 1a n=1 Tax=Sander lucioperca TaxID=283035 RepID=A0A8C9Y6T8_SANLU
MQPLYSFKLDRCDGTVGMPRGHQKNKMQGHLAKKVKSGSMFDIYQKHRPHFSVESNNARKLVATAAGNIEKLLANRSRALKVNPLKPYNPLQDSFETQGSAVLSLFVQLNQTEDGKGRKNRYLPDDFEIDPDFKRLVSYNTTAVHIPTDIYEGSTIILNELNWTEALEDTFRKNKEEDPSILWQVFGSATGLARYYPASPWIDSSNSTLIMGCAVLSGSVSGLTLKLIRTSVNKMLETLSDDDYVNVVYFNEKAMYASCFENLVQANVRNKRMLKDAVQSITAKGITNYRGGFELAFEQLAQMNVSRANCNKIIMLFTDGGEERAEEIFEKYNPKQVRIFTFSVGQHNYDKGPIQWMACANKGYYYEIPSIGAIRINTQVNSNNNTVLNTLVYPLGVQDISTQCRYRNITLHNIILSLGLVITGTLPVFNKTNTGSKLILGVMAIDVSLDDIKRLTPRFTFGPNGYYFAIDPNGYVLLHPNLQPLTAKFHEPVTLDFLDAELENEIKVEMRKQMIDGLTGNYTISTLVKSQDERYIDLGQRMYTFAPVKGTDYSLALVLPDYSMHYIRANIADTITQAKCKFSESLMADKFDEYGYTFIAPRMYCKDLKPPDKNKNNTEFLIEFNNYIDTKTPNNPMCDTFQIFVTVCFIALSSLLVRHGVLARFVATDGGITRVYPKSAGLYWKEEAETYESSFYKRSLDNDLYVFTPTPYLTKENISDDSVLVSRAVNLNIDGIILKPAGKDTLTHKERYVDCVILDDGGFLVMSNRDEYIDQIGRFFGGIDPILMVNLVNSSLFTSKKTFDYQSLCDPEKESKAAAGLRSVYVPTIADILNLGWFATAAMDDEMSDAMLKEVCITEQTQYYFENNDLSFRGTIDCENCTRLYHAEKLPKTNLVFIIADAKLTCSSCDTKPLIQDEQQSNGPDPCEMAQNPRYRKGPAVCFDNNEHEKDPDCGGASGLSPSLWLMAALQLVLLWVLTGSRPHAILS